MRVLTMSDAELDKLEIIRNVDLERMPVRAAAVVLGISERQVWRPLKRYRLQGAGGLISLKRGQPSNRKTPYDVRLAVVAVIKANYADFGPTRPAVRHPPDRVHNGEEPWSRYIPRSGPCGHTGTASS
jgi:hypothetical protein